MQQTLLALATFAWPPVAAWLVVKLVPDSLAKFVGKEIDRRSDAKLEKVKAEIQGAYSTLKASVDVVSTSNSGMRPHIITAVSALWLHMVTIKGELGNLLSFDSVFLAEEASGMFSGTEDARPLSWLDKFSETSGFENVVTSLNNNLLDEHRLFCGDRLWLLFYIYRAVLFRSAFLIQKSFEQNLFSDWREDKGVAQLLKSVLPDEKVTKVKAARFGGLATALAEIENDFLHEAARVMSGSKAIADSLSDLQATMLLQNAIIEKRNRSFD